MGRRTVLRSGAGILAGSLVTGSVAAQSDGGSQQWPIQRFDPANTGYNPDGTGPRANPTQLAQVDVGAAHRGDYLLSDDTVYIHSADDGLGAVDIGSGDLNWQFQGADAPLVPAFVDSEVVVVRSLAGPIYALDPADGSVVTEVSLGAGSGLGVDGEGRWFAPLAEGAVVAGEAGESGLWRTAVEGVPVQPAVADGRVYVSTIETSPEELDLAFPDETIEGMDASGRLYALDAEDGEILWESERVGAGIGAPAVRNGLVYWAGGDGDILVHDVETGEREWEFKTNGSFHTTPAVIDGTVFAGNADGTLYVLDSETGEEHTGPSTGASIRGGPVIVGDIVYWGDQAGTVVATDLSGDGDGWTFEVEGPIRALTVGHDRVIVSTDWAYWVLGEGDGSGGTTADGGSDTTTSTDGSTTGGSDFESTESAEPKRGLLANGGDEPEFISDGMNLTMLGFLLSVVGILHQMTQGR